MSDGIQVFLYGCVTALLLLLQRSGLVRRIENLEAKVDSHVKSNDEKVTEAIGRVREDIRNEIAVATNPLHTRLDNQDRILSQINTAVSTLVNRGVP